jgi:competence protein ComEA
MRILASALALAVLSCGTLSAQATHGGSPRRDAPKVQGVLNLNHANLDQLTLLPGIGPTKARRIVEFRTKHPFKRIEELTRIKGFGRKTFARLRAHLAVSGPTTLQRIRSLPDAAATVTPAAPAPQPLLAPALRPEASLRPGVIH